MLETIDTPRVAPTGITVRHFIPLRIVLVLAVLNDARGHHGGVAGNSTLLDCAGAAGFL